MTWDTARGLLIAGTVVYSVGAGLILIAFFGTWTSDRRCTPEFRYTATLWFVGFFLVGIGLLQFLVSHPLRVMRVLTRFRWNELLTATVVFMITAGVVVAGIIRFREGSHGPGSLFVMCLGGLPLIFATVLLVDSHPPRTVVYESQRILAVLRAGNMIIMTGNRGNPEEEEEQESPEAEKGADEEFGGWDDTEASEGGGDNGGGDEGSDTGGDSGDGGDGGGDGGGGDD